MTSQLYGHDVARPEPWLLWTHVQANARDRADATAVVQDGQRHTHGALAADAQALAGALLGLGVQRGDVVSYQLPNWVEAVVLFLAIQRLGAVANPIVTPFRQREVGFILNQARSRVLCVPAGYRGFDHAGMARSLDVPTLVHVITCRGRVPGLASVDDLLARGRAATLPPPPADPDARALLLYTSGTSGAPKGVLHSQRTLLVDAYSGVQVAGVTPRDINLVTSSVAHVTGVMHGHVIPQVLGAPMCLLDQWHPGEAAALIAREGCTWMTGATPFLHALMTDPQARQHDLSAFRNFRCGGAQVPPQLITDALARGIDAVRCYGATEHPTVSGISWGDPHLAATTDGEVHPHVQMRIVDPADETRLLGPGEVGEIHTRGPEMFLGYLDARLDAEGLTPDGWYRTGDLGSLSRLNSLEGPRHVTIVGRRKDIIIRKGENISAREVEEVLAGHPKVAQVVVIGLPDAQRGEMVTAVCVPRDGAVITLADIARHMEQVGVARQKFPERVECLDELPMTASGKPRKEALRQRFTSASE